MDDVTVHNCDQGGDETCHEPLAGPGPSHTGFRHAMCPYAELVLDRVLGGALDRVLGGALDKALVSVVLCPSMQHLCDVSLYGILLCAMPLCGIPLCAVPLCGIPLCAMPLCSPSTWIPPLWLSLRLSLCPSLRPAWSTYTPAGPGGEPRARTPADAGPMAAEARRCAFSPRFPSSLFFGPWSRLFPCLPCAPSLTQHPLDR